MCPPKICVVVTDLSTIPLLPPQDEEYAHQLQRELDAMLDITESSEQTFAVSHISLMSDLGYCSPTKSTQYW